MILKRNSAFVTLRKNVDTHPRLRCMANIQFKYISYSSLLKALSCSCKSDSPFFSTKSQSSYVYVSTKVSLSFSFLHILCLPASLVCHYLCVHLFVLQIYWSYTNYASVGDYILPLFSFMVFNRIVFSLTWFNKYSTLLFIYVHMTFCNPLLV